MSLGQPLVPFEPHDNIATLRILDKLRLNVNQDLSRQCFSDSYPLLKRLIKHINLAHYPQRHDI